MEVKGEDNLLLRLKTAPEADKSQLSVEYFEAYNQLKIESEVNKKLIEEKDKNIQRLENMLATALKSPKFNIQGEANVSGDRHIDIEQGNYNEHIEGDYTE